MLWLWQTDLLSTQFINPERMKCWVGLVGLPTYVITRQLQVERGTGKVVIYLPINAIRSINRWHYRLEKPSLEGAPTTLRIAQRTGHQRCWYSSSCSRRGLNDNAAAIVSRRSTEIISSRNFSITCHRELWPITLIFELYVDWVKLNRRPKYRGQT